MKNKIMLLSLFLMMFVVSNMRGAEVEMTSFATVSAMMDDYISYSTAKGGGTANPAVISGQIRLYQNSQGTGGGSITLEAKNGATITEVTIGSAMATQIRWQVNESVDSVSLDLEKGATTTLSGLSASTITCHCWGTTSSTRLYVNYLKVVYEVDENFTPDEGGDTPLEPQDEYWELVTDATSLLLDDQVVIVAKDIACALGPDKGNNRAQASVVKTDNRITLSEDVQILTLEQGTKDGTFALSTDSGYLYAASSISNQLKTKKEKDDDASWAITIADDIATIKAQGENERNWLRFNSSASVFSCYSSGQGDVLLYKHIVPGGVVSRPIISADSVEFFHAATVTIAAADSLEIYYTTDGSDPIAKQSTLYTGTFTLTEDALLKAIAYNATTDKSSKIVSQQFYHVPTITCQEASAIALAVSGDGVLTERTYRIVAYVTGNVEPVSSGQQVFDVADTADGESVLLSYYCQVPEGGVEIGMKVEMVGQLTKYNGIAEMKYGTVTILEGVPTTLYFILNTEWKQTGDAARFAAYLYGDTGASTWADMTLIDAEAGVYSFLVDRHLYDYVIFTRMNPATTENSWENRWNQSADITIPKDMNCATMDEGYWDEATVVWSVYGEVPDDILPTYTIAGSSGLLGTHWDVADTTNNMTLLEDGTYQLIKTDLSLVAGTYEYKVVRDHSWNWCLPAGPNQVLSIDKDGIYTITFILDLSNQTIGATAELQKEAVVIPKVFLIGTMNDWDYTATELQLAPDSLTASVSVTLNANTTYDFQMVVDGNWFTSYDGMMTRDNSQGWQFKHVESSTTYASVYTDIAGEYTFVWSYADNTVSVIYPDICSVAPELQWYNGIVMSQMQTGWYKLSVASLTEYASLTSVSLTNDLYNPVKMTVDYYTACEGFKIMQGTTTTFATGVTTVNVNIGELMNYIKYIPNIEFVYLYISIEEVEMGYAYQTITDYVCDADVYTDPITGNNHLISSLVPNSQIWTDTVHVHETLDSIYIFQITPIVAPERLYEDMLWQIGAVPKLVAGQPIDVTGTTETIMAYYKEHDTEALADVVRVEWVDGADGILPCDASTHTMTLQIETTCDLVMVFDYVFAVELLEVQEIFVESCGPYTWNGITFTESEEHYITNEEGCIVEILYLTVHPIEDEITSATICYGETFLWEVDGKEYTETTHVEVVKLNEYGCEITYILDLTVSTAPVVLYADTTICYGEYYDWIDGYYDATGVYETTIHNEYGCDSIIATLHLTVLPEVPETVIEKSIYDGEEYTWYDDVYTEEGEYSITLQDINGCDSVVTLLLTVKPIYEDEWALLQAIRDDLVQNNAWQTPWDMSEFVPWMYGITVENAHVIEINLSSQGLTGTFPTKILQLPHLKYLSLANNQLTGDAFMKIQTDMTTFVATNPTFVSALTDLDISYNQFTGNVGLVAMLSKLMPNLSTLQANNNRFKDVIPVIPQKINVDLSEQDIQQYVNLNLSNLDIDPKQIPTILLYNHAGQSYFTSPLAVDITNYVPLYAHKHSNPWGIMIDATNKDLMCLNGDAYKGKNGDTLYLSYPYAEVSRDSYCRMTLSFEMGDANFMDGVNITDLQSTILYAFNEYNQCAFNFTAADTYTDDRINVQDVIRTVDILLANAIDDSVSTTMSHIAPRTQVEAYEAEILIENNAIKLITSTPIAALQISAVGDVHWQMNNLAMEQTTAHHAVVAYSLTGNHIPVGETIIGYCQGNVELLHAELSDTDARLVPVKISGHRVPSALDNIQNTDSEQVIYDVLGRKHNQMNQQGLYIIKSDNQYIKVYNNK